MSKDEEYVLMEDIEAMSPENLMKHAQKCAELAVSKTQGDSWDDPEDYEIELIELAHAFFRMKRDGLI